MRFFLLLLVVTVNYNVLANYRVSLLTCGVGEELYASFGHSAVRIVDSIQHTDKVYNYGMFNFGDPNFYSKFVRGKLPYYADEENFESFIHVYDQEGRSVTEQVLNLDSVQASQILLALKENIKEENKYYKYDYKSDNCSTRIRDLFEKCLKPYGIIYPNNTSTDSTMFITILNSYLKDKHWERLGIDLILCNKIHDVANARETMFLPNGLMEGFANAKLDGKPLVSSTLNILLDRSVIFSTQKNKPLYFFTIVAVAVILFSLLKKNSKFLLFFDALFFLLLGLVGWLFVFMWVGTEHVTTYKNYNMLWASPLLLVLAYGITREKKWVASLSKFCFVAAVVAIILFYVFFQYIPIEVLPIILLLIYRLSHYARLRKSIH